MTNATEKRNAIRDWFIGHGDWATAMVVMVSCFAFVFHETMAMNHRLDDHITAIHKRCDEMSKRSDDLNRDINKRVDDLTAITNRQFTEMHTQFYDLLREIHRNERQRNQHSTLSSHESKIPGGFEAIIDGINKRLD